MNRQMASELDDLQSKIEAIEELRSRLKDVVSQEVYDDISEFYRFLKARDFVVDKAEAMLRKSITWRKVYQTDKVVENFKPTAAYLKYIHASYIGDDKEGCPLLYGPGGKFDARDIINCFKVNDYYRHWIWAAEFYIAKLKELSLKTGKDISKISYILDLKEGELANAIHPQTAVNYMNVAQIFQDNYPERLKKFYVINAPSFIVYAYDIIKRALAEEVACKIKIFGKTGWQEELMKFVDTDVLPAFLGGSRTDPDGNPMCHTVVNHGSRIPSVYFLTEAERSFKDKERVERIKIPPNSGHELLVEIQQSGTTIQWEYKVNKSIGFGLNFKVSDEEIEEILPIHRFETTDGTEVGSYKCQRTGTYIFVFDNTFSWINPKDLSYCITLMRS